MKAKLLLTVLLSFSFYLLSSQVPQGFNYQAVATYAGSPVTEAITVRITIQSLETGGETFWIEEHTGVVPNQDGVFNIVIGTKLSLPGSTAPSFADINWAVSPKYLKTQILYQSVLYDMGTSKLQSVPYSMVAKKLDGPVDKLGVKGVTTNMDEALFEVRNKSGQIVFAVYNEGVRIYVDDGDAKGSKGGFAIGGFDVDGKGLIPGPELMVVDPTKIRMYIDTNVVAKGPKGGFAIGGFDGDGSKGAIQDYLRINNNKTSFFINDNPKVKGAKGGFAIGGFSEAKGGINFLNVTPDNTRILTGDSEQGFGVGSTATGLAGTYMKLTSENYFIGHNSGILTTGKYNSFIGFEAGKGNIGGNSNVFLGFKSGTLNTTGSSNVFVGNESGMNHFDGENNTFLGYQSGYNNYHAQRNVFLGVQAGWQNDGWNNVFIGYLSGKNNLAGHDNVFMGSEAGFTNNDGYNNVFIGAYAGKSNTSGGANVFLGQSAGFLNEGGSSNLILGSLAGYNNKGGASNVFLGDNAGFGNVGGNNNVFLGTSSGYTNTSGTGNVFLGFNSGYTNHADNNVFLGYKSGYYNWGGINNVFLGYQSGLTNSSGSDNLFLGTQSGYSNSTGATNIFLGNFSGFHNTSGNENVFIGNDAGRANSIYGSAGNESNYNTFIGTKAGRHNITGYNNVYLGNSSGFGPWPGGSSGSNNVFLGNESGYSITSGTDNVFLGTKAGYNIQGGTTPLGSFNVFLGNEAGYSNTTGRYNVFLGHMAGHSNQGGSDGIADGSGNVYLGYWSGYNSVGGQKNSFVGFESGYFSKSAYPTWTMSDNVYLGWRAGYSSSGSSNILIGTNAGSINVEMVKHGGSNVMIGTNSGAYYTDAASNVLIGSGSGYMLGIGSNNVCIGTSSGYNLGDNTGNVFIGNDAGRNESGSNKLYIQNSVSYPPLIWGDFSTKEVKVFGNTFACISSATGDNTSIAIGRVNTEGRIAIAAGNSAWLLNTVAGDLIIRTDGTSQKIHLGANGSDIPNITVMDDAGYPGGHTGINRIDPAYPLQVGTSGLPQPNGNGAFVTTGGTWTNGSSRSFKDRFNVINSKVILDKVAMLDIESWYYKNTEEFHIGPVAEDFYNLFGTGDKNSQYVNKYLSSSDVAGVGLLAIQEIIRENDIQKSQIEKQKEEIDQLKSQNENLQSRMKQIEALFAKSLAK